MSSGLLGMDVGASRDLAATLSRWSTDIDDVIGTITAAEALSDILAGATPMLDQIGSDGSVMAAAIRRAADVLESFTLSIDSPLTIAAAVADVQRFNGSDNDPELDRRLRVLRNLVDAQTDSDQEAAQVMSQLLSAEQSLDIRFRDTSQVDAARAEVDRLNELEARGAISSNDPRIDQAVSALRDALNEHADGADQGTELLHAFVSDDERIATPTLLASVLIGQPVETVRVAHANNLDYDVADGLIKLDEVDRITAAMAGAPPPVVNELARQRQELLQALAGVDDPVVIQSLTEQLGDGVSAVDAFVGLEGHIANKVYTEQVDAVAEMFGLDFEDAEDRLEELSASTAALADQGWGIDDAATATQYAALSGIDLAEVEALAAEQDLPLVEALNKIAEAESVAMNVQEFDAYQGLIEHFAVLDNATGGDTDDVVSLGDLTYVVNNPDEFDPAVVAAAAAVVATPTLRNRLDTASENNDVLGTDPFGATRADDHKYSLTDLEQFKYKQAVNLILGDHLDGIDVAAQGGDLSLVDGTRRKEDFEAFLADNRADLSEQEIGALKLVIEADWYDKTFWQEHGDSITLAAAVVAGGVVFVATGGTGSGVTAALISTAYAAGAGATVAAGGTIAGNLAFGEDWDEDLLGNTVNGAFGGMGGAGLAAIPAGLASGSIGIKTATVLGGVADISGLTAAGLFDPALDPFLDDIALNNLKSDAQTTSYVTGAAAIGTVGFTLAGQRITTALDAANVPPARVDFANQGGEFIDDVVRPPSMLAELAEAGIKHDPDSIVRIARDRSGRVVFLETGDAKAGLTHIVDEHGSQFAGHGITEAQLPDFVMEGVTNGTIVGYQGRGFGRPIFEFTFDGVVHRAAITVGDNGFIVGANPK